MRDWVKEAEAYLHSQYTHACAVLDANINPVKMTIAPRLEEDEARYFVLGLEGKLFSVDREGYVQSSMLPHPTGKNTKQKMIQLFWTKKNGRGLFREGVCQLATVSSLILEYGWSSSQITMEPGIAEFGNLAYGVDILIRDLEENITICGEVKKDFTEYTKLIKGFRYCCQRGLHAKSECAFPQNHAKYEFCSEIKPAYFFVTAPGTKNCFNLRYDGILEIVNEVQGLPRKV